MGMFDVCIGHMTPDRFWKRTRCSRLK